MSSVCIQFLVPGVFSNSFLDINGLVGNSLPVKIPTIVVKWITYVLVLHVVALGLAAGSAVFGLLAHVREMAMTCCSTCISGFAAVITLIALIFDIVLFFVAKTRINAIGHAQIGNAIWLTLGAWALLLFSGCFYTLGRCCMRGRPSSGNGGSGNWFRRDAEGSDKYADQMRLDAVKAEADRKARQKQGEVGLPAFFETQPLTGHVEGDQIHLEGGQSKPDLTPPPNTTNFKGGYSPGPTGTRTVDAYYHNNNSSTTLYPPQEVRRQRSEYSTRTTASSPPISHAIPSGYGQYGNVTASTSPPPNNQLLVPSGHQPYNNDPYGREYGHSAGGTSCKYKYPDSYSLIFSYMFLSRSYSARSRTLLLWRTLERSLLGLQKSTYVSTRPFHTHLRLTYSHASSYHRRLLPSHIHLSPTSPATSTFTRRPQLHSRRRLLRDRRWVR